MYSIRSIILFFALVSVCYSQQPKPAKSSLTSSSVPRNATSSRSSSSRSVSSRPSSSRPSSSLSISITPTKNPGRVPSSRSSSSLSVSITPTEIPTRVPSSVPSTTSSAPAATVTVDHGETVTVLPGVVVVGAGVGGFFTVNGVTTPIAAGATVVAGAAAPKPNPNDPSKPDDPDPKKSDSPEPSKPASTAETSSTRVSSSTPPSSTTSSETSTSSTSSSAAPSGTSADYMILAKDNTGKVDADGFSNTLAGLVGADNMETIVNDADVPFVWRANLNDDQLAKVKANSIVAGVEVNDPIPIDDTPGPATRRKRAELAQNPVANNDIFDLRTLSTPPRVKDTLPDYRFDDFAGQGITVYVIDGGPFDLQHAEFASPGAGVTRRQLSVARNKKIQLLNTEHGTCVASKVVGVTAGTAKRANLVGVAIDFDEFGLLRGFQAALNDIKKTGLRGKAVVTTSVGFVPSALSRDSMRSLIRGLMLLDVPVVAAAGNDFLKGVSEPNELPAVMAKEFPIIVVGSAKNDFQFALTSQRGDLVTTFAIGDKIKCADAGAETQLVTKSGTSFAAPQVAGMVAYWMSHPEFALNLGAPGKVAELLRNITGALSYQRVFQAEFPPIAWNGHDLAESCALPKSGTGRRVRRGMRRDLAQACSFAPTSTVSAAPTGKAPGGPAPTGNAPTGNAPTSSTSTSSAPGNSAPTGSNPVPPPLPSAPASTACNLCGAELSGDAPGNLGGQVGCTDAEVARSACAANDACKSWAFGQEDRGKNTVPVCLLFTDSATKIVNQAPADPQGKCPFRYNDKACPAS